MLLRQGPHLLGMKVQRVLRVINLGRLVRRRGEQNDFNARSLGGDNHRRPVGLGLLQAEAAVIQGIINRHDGRAYCEDVALKTRSTTVGSFATDRGDDDIEHGVWKAGTQASLESRWIGLIGLNDGRDEITRRDAVPVADDMHRSVLRPLHFEGLDDRPQGGGLGGSEAEGEAQQGKQGTHDSFTKDLPTAGKRKGFRLPPPCPVVHINLTDGSPPRHRPRHDDDHRRACRRVRRPRNRSGLGR